MGGNDQFLPASANGPPACIQKIAARDSDRRAFWWRGEWLDYGWLASRIAQTATRLRDSGLRPGDRIAVVGDCEPVLLVTVLAAWSECISVAPLSAHLQIYECASALDVLDASAIVDAQEANFRLRMCGPRDGRATSTLHAARGEGPDDEQLVLLTSGSSGTPKGVRISRSRRWDLTRSIVRAYELDAEDVLLPAVPLVHSSGLTFALATLSAGGALVLSDDRTSGSLTPLLANHPITLVLGVPTTLERLVRQSSCPLGAPELRTIVSMGSASSRALRRRLQQSCPGAKLVEYYGCTEHPHVTWLQPVGDCPPSCVGTPFDRVEVRVVDPDGIPLTTGEVGTVELSGPFMMLGYLDGAASKTFRTGDLGYFDDDGHLNLAGRSDHVMITGGLNVHPGEVEHVLLEHPAVSSALVYSRPDPELGARIVAVVTVEGADEDLVLTEVRELCTERLTRHKRPWTIRVVDDLPKGPTGKVLRGDAFRRAVDHADETNTDAALETRRG